MERTGDTNETGPGRPGHVLQRGMLSRSVPPGYVGIYSIRHKKKLGTTNLRALARVQTQLQCNEHRDLTRLL